MRAKSTAANEITIVLIKLPIVLIRLQILQLLRKKENSKSEKLNIRKRS